MKVCVRWSLLIGGMLLALACAASGSVSGVDVGMTAQKLIETTAPDELARWGATGAWLRIRDVPEPVPEAPTILASNGNESLTASATRSPTGEPDAEAERRTHPVDRQRAEVDALRKLRELGFRPLLHVRWNSMQSESGTRPGGGHRVPLDLREAFERAKRYRQAYGDVATGFEFDNEPDLMFVAENAETYTAFLKACYLGVKEGGGELRAKSQELRAKSQKLRAKCQELRAKSAERRAGSQELRAESQELGPKSQVLITKESVGDATPSADLRSLTSDVLSPTSDFRPLTSDLRSPTSDLRPPTSDVRPLPSAFWRRLLRWRAARAPEPWAVMAPLGLPPGPYFEQMVANGFWSYTDAFNYHYYGYAEDFSRVYQQFRSAAMESRRASRDTLAARRADRPVFKRMPVILSEYGFGELSDDSGNTVPGRIRQWKWFRDVAGQIRRERIAGPMAFYLPPYYERKAFEFGLTVESTVFCPVDVALKLPPSGESAGTTKQPVVAPCEQPGAARCESDATTGKSGDIAVNEFTESGVGVNGHRKAGRGKDDVYRAGELAYRRADFGAEGDGEWVRGIGRRFGGRDATPALAWLIAQSEREPYKARDWKVRVPRPSRIVIDFVAGAGLAQLKRYQGYLELPAREARSERAGELVVYNFSDRVIRGRLEWEFAGGNELEAGEPPAELVLEPRARHVTTIRLRGAGTRFARTEWRVRFVPVESHEPAAEFVTAFFPDTAGMREQVRADLRRVQPRAAGNRTLLLHRSLARDEQGVQPSGRWLVTPGLTVTEHADGGWRFTIHAVPPGTYRRRVMAELPLPDAFEMSENGALRLSHRLAKPAGTVVGTGKYFEISFRTANGNAYVVWPWSYAVDAWTSVLEIKENFGTMFYSRANVPWRFRANRPVALEFSFAPLNEEIVFEVRDARIVTIGK